MPLIHSKRPAAFKKNIETEMEHGKGQKQAVAIAYHEADEAKRDHKAKGGEMCAHGGRLHCNMGCYDAGGDVSKGFNGATGWGGIQSSIKNLGTSMPSSPPKMMAEGGEMKDEEPEREESGEDDTSHELAKEMMGAMDRKDHKGVSQAMEAMILHHMSKGEM